MNTRNSILLGLINKKQEDIQPTVEEEPKITQGPISAPEPEILTPKQQFRLFIEEAKKIKKKKNNGKKKKKLVHKLIEYFEENFPILDDDEDIF